MLSISIIIANNNILHIAAILGKSMTLTTDKAIQIYLQSIGEARSTNTARTYRTAMNSFKSFLDDMMEQPTEETNITDISEAVIGPFAAELKALSPATEQLYLTALAGFFDYLVAERLADINLARVRLLIRKRSRKPGVKLPQFPQMQIADTIIYANNLANVPVSGDQERLINLRDRAFILTLVDTGLRVHEACNLRRGDLDWNEMKAVVKGKGNREDIVRFSPRSLEALKTYLEARAMLDGGTGRQLSSLPLFARHDKGAGKKIKPITPTTGRNIVDQRVTEAIGDEAGRIITPHSFRHYFVTTVLIGSGGNLKMAQSLARHKNIAVTQRYAHLSDNDLDRTYMEIFGEESSRDKSDH
jgi:integrase/recombinase XerC